MMSSFNEGFQSTLGETGNIRMAKTVYERENNFDGFGTCIGNNSGANNGFRYANS